MTNTTTPKIKLSPPPDLSESKPKRMNRPAKNSLPLFATVVALDPGETTGWALWNVHPEALIFDDEKILANIHMWTHGQVECTQRFDSPEFEDLGVAFVNESEAIGVAELVGLLRSWPGAAVVVESFILRQSRKDATLLSPVRITAAVSQWLWQQRRSYFVQQPSMAKTTVTDDRMKRWGIYERSGGQQHARDADRHAMTFLRRCKGQSAIAQGLRHKAWPHLFDANGEPLFEVDR